MKKLAIYTAMALAVAMSSTSCSDFLEVKAVGSTDEEALLNEDGIEMVITGMYSNLFDRTGNDYWGGSLSNYYYGDVMGGSANKGSTFTDQSPFTNLETYAITADNGYLETKWKSVYNGVYSANVVADMTEKLKDELSGIQGEERDKYTEAIAQADFFRAFWHFEGMKLFGAAIPYVGLEEYRSDVDPKVSNVDESGNYIYIWDKVITDLQYAYENLPNTWAADKGKVNKWAAGALLAKVMMYQSSPYNGKNGTQNRWAEVKTLLEEIIANGVDNNGTKYKLDDDYETLYIAGECDWTGESVFDIQMAIIGTQEYTNCINGTAHIALSGSLGAGGWGFYQPSYDMVNSYIVNEEGLPLLDGSYQQHAPLSTAPNLPAVETDLSVYTDPRLDVSVGRFNVPFYDWAVPTTTDGWVRDVANGGLYMNKKNLPRKADKGSLSVSTIAGSTAKNFHLIRYADVLLWYAEALIETGHHTEAREYVNMVRARAAKSYIHAVDGATMAETTSSYVFDDKVDGTTGTDAAANYRLGLYPESQFATKEKATEALRFERKLEMALEGHRWYDLARWGIIGKELNNYLNYEKQYLTKFSGSVYNDNWVMLPIPQTQIITMQGLLVQNESWK